MTGDCHVRFCESRGAKSPPATHLNAGPNARSASTPKTGFFAPLSALLPTNGTAAPAAVLCGVALALTFALGVASASAAPPTVTIEPASSVGFTTALAKGTVNPEGHETSCRFEYITDAQFEENVNVNSLPGFEGAAQTPCAEPLIGNAAQPVQATLENLSPNTTYHLRLFAENSGAEPIETAAATAATFTTEATTQPTAEINLPSEVSYVTAHLSGKVNPEGGNVNPIGGPIPISWQLQFSLASEPGNWQLAKAAVIEGPEAEANTPIEVQGVAGDGTFSAPLQPATAYVTRLLVTNAGGEVIAAGEPGFETLPVAAPAVTIDPVTTFTATTAHLSGEVNPEGADPAFNSSCRFDYVTDAQFNLPPEEGGGFAAAAQVPCEPNPVEGAGAQEVNADLSGLTPHTTYHLRLVASNADGQSEAVGAETLTTKVQAPLIAATSAANVTATSADLRAQLNPGGGTTTYHFDYGTTAAYGSASAESSSIGSDNVEHAATFHLSGLVPGTTYHYRVLATNSASPPNGSPGPDHTFTTQPASYASALPDGRQWELVSPVDKHGAEVTNLASYSGGLMQAADDGSAVSYITNAPTGSNPQSSPLENQVYSRRGPTGWNSQDISTPHAGASAAEWTERLPVGTPGRLDELSEYLAFSPDLSLAYVEPEHNTPLASPAPPPKLVLEGEPYYDGGYVRDNATGTFTITDLNSKEWYDEQLASSLGLPLCDAETSPAGGVVGQEGVRAVSQDGCYVYFNSEAGAGPLSVAHFAGAGWTSTIISALSGAGEPEWGGHYVELSPNGRFLAFMSEASLTGYDSIDADSPPGAPQADVEVYLYDAVTDELVCPSCDPTGARASGQLDNYRFAEAPSGGGNLQVDIEGKWAGHRMAGLLPGWPTANFSPFGVPKSPPFISQPRYLTNEGVLFFQSPLALAPQDVNDAEDVYQYEPNGHGDCVAVAGCVALISSGKSSGEAVLVGASTDGSDVFFFTQGRLAPQDIDTVPDMYDAHVCSTAVPCPPPTPVSPPPCDTADSCKAAPLPQPSIYGEPSSSTYSGVGNVHEGKPKKKRRKRHHAKKRANNNRRAGR